MADLAELAVVAVVVFTTVDHIDLAIRGLDAVAVKV
jgi:hypothetical protein